MKFNLHWLNYVIMNTFLAGIVIYFFNFTNLFTGVHIPLNFVTAIVIGILGIPGLLLIAALKLTLL